MKGRIKYVPGKLIELAEKVKIKEGIEHTSSAFERITQMAENEFYELSKQKRRRY